MWTLRPEAQRGGLNHRTRLEANKMVWAGGDGQLWSCDHRGTSGTEWVNFHCHPTLEFELTWLLYTQGWHQAHTCYHTLRCCRGSVSMVTQSPHTTDIPLPPSPPQERVPTALGVSELGTREGFILVWCGSAKVIIVLNPPFVLLVQNYNYQCPAPTNSIFFQGSWTYLTLSSGIQILYSSMSSEKWFSSQAGQRQVFLGSFSANGETCTYRH